MVALGGLAGLWDVGWDHLTHAYGAASDIPRLLERVVETEGNREDIWSELWSRLCHQGTVYSASAAAVPFLMAIANMDALSSDDRTQTITLLAAVAAGQSYLDVHEPLIRDGLTPEEQHAKAEELSWVQSCHAATAAAAPELLPRLALADGTELKALVNLAAQVGAAARPFRDQLANRADPAASPEFHAAVQVALMLVDEVDLTRERLVRTTRHCDPEVQAYLESLADFDVREQASMLVSMLTEDY